jgi:uncharacterized protein (TIGR02145 family)
MGVFQSCGKEPRNSQPVAFFTINPEAGDTETDFTLNASESHDAEDPDSILEFRWDYEGDGMWDYPFVKTRINVYRFPRPGDYSITLQVRDHTGATSEYSRDLAVTQGNKPPLIPFGPNPRDSASNIIFNGRLSWIGIDPDNPEIRFDVYLGTQTTPGLVASELSVDEYFPDILPPGRRYYWRVVSHDPGGLSVSGPVWNFSIHSGIYIRDSITDPRDNRRYPVIKLGSQWWMTRNLDYAYPGASVFYDNDPENGEKYGRLYHLGVVDTLACPPGWTIPHDQDWIILEKFLGMSEKDANETGWRGVDQGTQLLPGGTSGMEIQLGGYRDYSGVFNAIDNQAYFRYYGTAGRMIMRDYNRIYRQNRRSQDFSNVTYFSIRCIRRY